ncbi:MAG: sigma-54-dependent Fis family transcriptional regulator [Gemmatimonadaceae bacterium]|nr:sigma-54-dependent Fis family transcriptional regulator [Acetobacteraceae bacterium]
MTSDVRLAWETFQRDGTVSAGVRPAVLASWRRSRQHDIAASRPETTVVTDAEFHRCRQEHLTLLHAARPAMESAREFLAGANSMAILTDPTGTVLETAGDARAMDLGYAVKLQRGGRWGEADIGTNAIGTAIAAIKPVQIHATEHFCSEVQRFTCAAAPVRHPLDRCLLGVVDISGPAQSFSPQSLAHAVAMAHQIEASIGRRIAAEHDHILRYYLGKRSLWLTDEVVAFGRGGNLIYSTDKALREIQRCRPELLADGRLAFLKESEPALWPSRVAALLPGASVELVTEDGRDVGGVLVLHNVRRARLPKAREAEEHLPFDAILGHSPAMCDARDKARRMADSGAPILLEGETGVGKELFARAIHAVRAPAGPFVPVNCGGLSRDLVASEMFGYEKGAFTGADGAGRPGKVEVASGGLLCLDEIGEMPLDLQTYLLRVLEDGVVYRVGGHEARRVKLSLVSMTNRDLSTEIAAGRFRRDLYYRIATLRLRIPPLRDRGDDILLLLEQLGRAAALRARCEPPRFTPATLDALRTYSWPGNVRELRNLVELVVIMSPCHVIGLDDLPAEFQQAQALATTLATTPAAQSSDLRSVEQATIAEAVQACGGNFTKAAKRLGIARSTLYTRYAALDRGSGDPGSRSVFGSGRSVA